jgi:hypothetical protein
MEPELDSEEGARRLHRLGVQVYEQQGHGNFSTTLIIVPEGSDQAMLTLLTEMQAGKAYAYIQQAIMALGVTPKIVAFTSDVFIHDMSSLTEEQKDNALSKNRMPLADLFAIGDPTVFEALTTLVLSEEHQFSIVQRYKYTDEDGFEWGEEDIAPEGAQVMWDFKRLINGEPKLDMANGYPICPLCDGYIPNNDQPGAYPGALSRRDNKTEICSECGVREAFAGFIRSYGGNE